MSDRVVVLLPPDEAARGHDDCEESESQSESVPKRGVRRIGQELQRSDRGGEESEGRALPREERALICEREAVIGLARWRDG